MCSRAMTCGWHSRQIRFSLRQIAPLRIEVTRGENKLQLQQLPLSVVIPLPGSYCAWLFLRKVLTPPEWLRKRNARRHRYSEGRGRLQLLVSGCVRRKRKSYFGISLNDAARMSTRSLGRPWRGIVGILLSVERSKRKQVGGGILRLSLY